MSEKENLIRVNFRPDNINAFDPLVNSHDGVVTLNVLNRLNADNLVEKRPWLLGFPRVQWQK